MNLPFYVTFEQIKIWISKGSFQHCRYFPVQHIHRSTNVSRGPSMVCKIGPTSAPTRRKKKAAQVSSCLSVADTWCLQRLYKKNGWEMLLISLPVLLRLTSPICHNPDLLHRRLSGGLLISIRPSSWFVLIRSFGAFGFLGLYTSCMFLMRLIVSVQECWFDKHKLIHCLQRVTNESLVSSGTPFRICNSNVDNSNCPIAFGVVSPG